MKKRFFACAAGLTFCIAVFVSSCSCTGDAHARLITVMGVSTVYVTPDRVTVSFAAVSKDTVISTAKSKNDALMKAVNLLFDKYGIEQKDITAGNLRIEPLYSYRQNSPEFLHYKVTQHVSVSINDLKNYEPFLTELLNSGIDKIDGVRFSVSQMKKYRDEARAGAVRAAEEKAAFLCAAAENGGKKLSAGKVVRITEIPSGEQGMGGGLAQNKVAYLKTADGFASEGEAGSTGQIQIDAYIEMTFELR